MHLLTITLMFYMRVSYGVV